MGQSTGEVLRMEIIGSNYCASVMLSTRSDKVVKTEISHYPATLVAHKYLDCTLLNKASAARCTRDIQLVLMEIKKFQKSSIQYFWKFYLGLPCLLL